MVGFRTDRRGVILAMLFILAAAGAAAPAGAEGAVVTPLASRALVGLSASGGIWPDAPAGTRMPSRSQAIGASLLLPGWGQRLSGHRQRGTLFMVAEAAIWIGFGASQVEGYVRKDGYIEYAERFGGVGDAEGREDWYYRNLGQYGSSAEYVQEVARTARNLYGDDLAARDEYVERNRPTPDEAWRWRSEADRLAYRDRRKASRNAFRRANLLLGGALLNRLLSAVDAAILAGRTPRQHALYYRPSEEGLGYVCLQWAMN